MLKYTIFTFIFTYNLEIDKRRTDIESNGDTGFVSQVSPTSNPAVRSRGEDTGRAARLHRDLGHRGPCTACRRSASVRKR